MFARINFTARILAGLALAVAVILPGLAVAGADPSGAEGSTLPYRGMYYVHGQGGTGLTVDVDKNGFVFAVFYAYDKDGKSTYYLMQGTYEPNAPDDVIDTGVIGTMNADVYLTSDGQCVGADCPYKSPAPSATGLTATITWTSPRQAHLEIGTQSWDVLGGVYTVSDDDFLQGDWVDVVTVYAPGEVNGLTVTSGFTIQKTDLGAWSFKRCPATSKYYTADSYTTLPDDAVIYSIGKVQGHGQFLYRSESTGRSGYFRSNGKCIGTGTYQPPLSISSPIMITGPDSFRVYAKTIGFDGGRIPELDVHTFVRLTPGAKVPE